MDDIDRSFEDIFLAEDKIYQKGYDEGYDSGRQQGLEEGRRIGAEKGRILALEVGFYSGFAGAWLESDGKKSHAEKALKQLKKLTDDFPLDNPRHPDIIEKLDRIRAKFKQVTSLLGVSTEYSPSAEVSLTF
eukprot:m.11435 g.11435  ORF g.11435 m.11435 type:complete len:132 (+) comp23317_c0_seq1:16-411(+)